MATVKSTPDHPIPLETMISLFKRKVERDGIMDDMRDHSAFKSDSQKRREQLLKAKHERDKKHNKNVKTKSYI